MDIRLSLGLFTGNVDEFIGVKVTLGLGGQEVGKITGVEIVDGRLMATATIEKDHSDLVFALLTDEHDLIKPKIEVNLRPIPVGPLLTVNKGER